MNNQENYGKKWTRDETILALSFYYEMPYGQISSSNKYLREMAELMQRSPSSLAMKMVNLAALDEKHLSRGVTSLPHGSKMDKEVWNEFKENYQFLVLERERILANYNHFESETPSDYETLPDTPDEERYTPTERTILVRKGQNFFRKAVLSAYNKQCCMTGIAIPELLQACHIMPWSKCTTINARLNPSNGLCLNYLSHKAFDLGYISIHKTQKTIMISNSLKEHTRLDETTKHWLIKLDGQSIILPERNTPNTLFLEYHNDCIFQQ